MTIPAKQHGLIPMTKDLRSNANTHAIPQQRCRYPMSDVMHSGWNQLSIFSKLAQTYLANSGQQAWAVCISVSRKRLCRKPLR
jgi:hypothetical protein